LEYLKKIWGKEMTYISEPLMGSQRTVAGPLSEVLKPMATYRIMCARCGKPVEAVDIQREDYDLILTYRFKCHGNVEYLKIDQRMMMQDPDWFRKTFRNFKVFAGPTEEEKEIARLKAELMQAKLNTERELNRRKPLPIVPLRRAINIPGDDRLDIRIDDE